MTNNYCLLLYKIKGIWSVTYSHSVGNHIKVHSITSNYHKFIIFVRKSENMV